MAVGFRPFATILVEVELPHKERQSLAHRLGEHDLRALCYKPEPPGTIADNPREWLEYVERRERSHAFAMHLGAEIAHQLLSGLNVA